MRNKVIGITRVRNESHIIMECLDNAARFCDAIVVLDDASTDNTLELVLSHPMVIQVIENKIWETDRNARLQLEGLQRSQAYNVALEFLPDWIYVFDADEFADFEGIDLSDETVDAYKMRLYDYYITKEDAHLSWKERTKIGVEYRDITMLFRTKEKVRFSTRVPQLPPNYRVKTSGSVKHYGKAISIEEWEETCKYYVNHLAEPGISEKWAARVGKAIHTVSDFGNPLISWENRKIYGIPLVDNMGK